MEKFHGSDTERHFSGKFLNKNSIWNTKMLLPGSSWVAVFILVTALRASLLGKELNLLSNLKGNIGVWHVLKRKLSSRSWFLRTRTKHLHHLKSWILSGWQRKDVWWESHAELTACSHWQGLLLPLFAPMKYVFFPSPSNGAHPCQQGKFASFIVFS